MSKDCCNCGAHNSNDAKYCFYCGTELEETREYSEWRLGLYQFKNLIVKAGMFKPGGRINRVAFLLFDIIDRMVGFYVDNMVGDMGGMFLLLEFCFVYAPFCIANKRLHDIGFNGWAVALLITVLPGISGMLEGEYAMKNAFHSVNILIIILDLYLLLVPGQRCTNKYGPYYEN